MADESGQTGIAAAADFLDVRRAAALVICLRRLEGGRAHGNDLDGIGALHRLHGIAGVNGADEGVFAFDRGDFGNLLHVQQRRHPGHQVLAEGGRRR